MLVSMRDTWAAYLVDIGNGKDKGDIIWTLGGRHSTFKLGRNAAFQWQHDVKLAPDGNITMFDDHCCQLTSGGTYVAATANSRSLTLKLDLATHTATVAAPSYGETLGIKSDYMGNTQDLPNGNVMVGWGSTPYLSEWSRSGTQLLGGVLPGEDLSYRALVEPWVGLPPLRWLAGAARRTGAHTTVYASWNGSTELAAWRVLASVGGRFTAVAHARRSGFETAIPVTGDATRFEVQALDAGGAVLGTSAPFGVPR
jgi:hypothetical protein